MAPVEVCQLMELVGGCSRVGVLHQPVPLHSALPSSAPLCLAGLQVKNWRGQWSVPGRGVPPGCLLVLAGEALQQLSGGLCRASLFRALSHLPDLLLPAGLPFKNQAVGSTAAEVARKHGVLGAHCWHPITRYASTCRSTAWHMRKNVLVSEAYQAGRRWQAGATEGRGSRE